MKLKDMFSQYFKDREKETRRDSGREAQPMGAEQRSASAAEVVPFTGTPPGSDVRVVPEMLEQVTPSTKGAL